MMFNKTLTTLVFALTVLSGFSGWKEDGINEVTLGPSTAAGTVLNARTVYHVTNDVTIGADAAIDALVLKPGITVIDIAENCTLKATGGNAHRTGGGAAGILLPTGAVLVVTGKGRLEAKGGDASKGEDGSNGSAAVDGYEGNARGGDGGAGGGGAGAAIGGRGGAGGSGGEGVVAKTTIGLFDDMFGCNGASGNGGDPGSAGADCGDLVLLGDLAVNMAGGGTADGESKSGDSSDLVADLSCHQNGFLMFKTRTLIAILAGSSGAGGGGYPGSVAPYFGRGGSGGGGGGAGGSSGIVSASAENFMIDALMVRVPWPIRKLLKMVLKKAKKKLSQDKVWKVVNVFRDAMWIEEASGGCGGGWRTSPSMGSYGRSTLNFRLYTPVGGKGGNAGPTPAYAPSGKLFYTDRVRLGYSNSEINHQVARSDSTYASGIVSEIVFNRQGGTGGSDTAKAELGMPMPKLVPPKKTGFAFRGYFTEPNGGGDRYYAANGMSVRSWDIAQERVTLYANWVSGDECGIRVNGKDPALDSILGVSFSCDTKIVTLESGHGTYLVSGTAEPGVRLLMRCDEVCFSNLTIHLPPQTAAQLKEYAKLGTDAAICRSPLTVSRPGTTDMVSIILLGSNVLIAEESGEGGGPDTSVPAISLRGDSWNDFYVLVLDSGFGDALDAFGGLKLRGAGGAPAICVKADVTSLLGLSSSLGKGLSPVVINGGTYEFTASEQVYDSGLVQYGAFQKLCNAAIGFDGSLRCIVNSFKAAGHSDPWTQFKVDLLDGFTPIFNDSNVALFQSSSADPGAVKCASGMAGEVLVDVESDHEDDELVEVVSYTDESFSAVKSVFRSIRPIRGRLHLWLDAGRDDYFTVDGVCYRAHPIEKQSVWAVRIDSCVVHVETGCAYMSLTGALASVASASSATLRLLTDIDGELIACAINGNRRLLIDGGGHVISNACPWLSSPMFKVGGDSELVVSNASMTGFRSLEMPMFLNLGRLRLLNCRLCRNNVGTDGALVSSESVVTDGVDFEASQVKVYHNVCANAIRVDSPDDGVRTLLRSGSVDINCQNGLYVVDGRVDLDENVHSITPVRLGCTGNIAYRDAAPGSVRLTLDDPARRCRLEVPVIVNAYDHPVAATNVFASDAGYNFYNNATGDVMLSAEEVGSVFVALDESTTNKDYQADCDRMAEFDDYADLPAEFGPTVGVWAVRWTSLTSGITNEGSACAIVITNGLYVDFGSVEYAQTNALVVTEDWECAPVTLDGPVIVDGALRLGNVIFSNIIILGPNATLIIGDEYPTNVPIRVDFHDPMGQPRVLSGRPLEDVLKLIVPKQRRYRPRIRDGKEIVFDESTDDVVWLGTEQGQRLYKSTSYAFGHILTNDVAHLLSLPGKTVVGLDWETRLGDGKNVIVNSGVYDGDGWSVGGTTTLDATDGSLLIGRDSCVQLTNVLVHGTLQLGGEGVLDLAGWIGDPIAVDPLRSGRIARNVPKGKLVLGPDVKGTLWRNEAGDVYYGKNGLIEWDYSQEVNGAGTLFVTNILGEATNFVLNAERYASITNEGLARVQIDYPELGFSTNLTVYVFYCDLDSGRVYVPDLDGYRYKDEDGAYQKFERVSLSAILAEMEAVEKGIHTDEDGDEELRMNDDGTIVTNKPAKLALASARGSAGADVRLAAAGFGDVVSFMPVNVYVDVAKRAGFFEWAGKEMCVKFDEWDGASDKFANGMKGSLNLVHVFRSFAFGSGEEGVHALCDQFSTSVPSAVRLSREWAKGKNLPKVGRGAFLTTAGIQAVCNMITGLIKHKITPIQYRGKYYFRDHASRAYERCIEDGSDSAVHIQSTCELPPYEQTNGTLRISGKYEGGFKSVLYGMVSNGKQWISGAEGYKIASGPVREAQRLAWGVYAWKKMEDVLSLATQFGGAVGNLVSQTIQWTAGPYGATSNDKAKPLFTVKNGATLEMKRVSLRGNEDSGAQVSVEDGGTAVCDDIKLKKGYTLGYVKNVKGVYTVKSGGTLTLKDVKAFKDCNVLCVEDGASSMTLDGGDFDNAGFVLNGDALTMTSRPGGDGVQVSGARSGMGAAFAQKGDMDKQKHWADFKSAADDSLVADIDGDRVVWKLGDPIGNVKGGGLAAAVEFSNMAGASKLISQAGDGAYVTMTKDEVTVPKDWQQAVAAGTVTFDGGNKILTGNGKKREQPLFAVSGSGRLVLKNMNLEEFKGRDTSLIAADGGTLEASACSFDKNEMAVLFEFVKQSSCTSQVAGVTFKEDDESDYAIRYDSSGPTNRTIFVSGTFEAPMPILLSGEGSVRIGKDFKADRFCLHDTAALAYPDGVPSVTVGIMGSESHLDGIRCVVDNSFSSGKASAEAFDALNNGYTITNRTDGNLYLCDPRVKPPVAGNELVYTWSNDVFSVMNGFVPSVGDTNWMARTVSGTNAVFNLGRIARDAYVNTTNGDLVVCCRGTNFTMTAIGATDVQTEAAITNVLSLVNDILVDGTGWFDGATVSNATKTALGACVTRRELEATAAEMTNALWHCAARFSYDGRLYLEGDAQAVFDAASQSGIPVLLMQNARVHPYLLESGTLNLVAVTNHAPDIFGDDLVRADVALPWAKAIRLEAEIDRRQANVQYGIYSIDDWQPALTVEAGAVAAFYSIVCTNRYPCESITVEAGGMLAVDGHTFLASVEASDGAVKGFENFSGAVGLSGRASCCGVPFGVNKTKCQGVFYSRANDFATAKDKNGNLSWALPPSVKLEDLVPVFAEDEPFSITVDTNDVTRVIVHGRVLNVESGLWYGFASSTNLTEAFETVRNSTMSTTSGDHRFAHVFQMETNACGQVVDRVRFFKFRVSDMPPEK